MPHGGYHGTIVMGSGPNQQVVQEPGEGFTAVRDTGSSNKKTKKDDSDTKKGKQTFRSKFVYGGSKGVDESVKKEDYDNPSKHKLRNQFDYLADKYYGGSKEDFAKTSQGQVLLGYLSGVSADRGGGRGGDVGALQAGAPTLFKNIQGLKSPRDLEFIYNRPIASDIRNLSAQAVKDNLKDYASRTGITGTEAFNRFNEALQVAAPDAYAQARPFSSGQGIGTLIEQGAGFVPGLGLASRFIGNLLPQRATGGLSPDEYLSQDLFANLPMDERVDTGGVNDVAQSIINNQASALPSEEDVVAINPEDMVLPNFGVDPPTEITQPFFPSGGVTEVLPGFDLNDTLRLLASRGIFSPTTVT